MATRPENLTANKLRQILVTCPICRRDFTEHRFLQLASTVAIEDNKRRVQNLIEAFKGRRWDAVAGFSEFRGDANAAVVHIISGPHAGAVALLICDPVELYEPPELCLQEILSAGEVEAITMLYPRESWESF